MKPVIVVTRYPDQASEVIPVAFKRPVQIIILDFGGSFEIGHIGPEDRNEVMGWIEGHREEVKHLSKDHPARAMVEQAISEVLDEIDEKDLWGICFKCGDAYDLYGDGGWDEDDNPLCPECADKAERRRHHA